MRKEASLEQWRELYEVALKIKGLEPWKYLWDMDIITIKLPEYEQPFYCSVMGKNNECYAIGVYSGYDEINDFYKIADNNEIPLHQIMRYQNNLMCYFGNREDLKKKEMQLIKDLGYKFRGKNEWIYFHSFKTGYVPYILDEEQVLKLTLVFRQLFMALRAFIENGLEVDFENGKTMYRHYDDEKELWLTFEMPNITPSKEYLVPALTDELLVKRLSILKYNDSEIEIDIVYLYAVINDKKYERPILPKIILMADRKSGLLLNQYMMSPEDDDVQEIFGSIIGYIQQNGKPKTIYVRDEYISHLLSDLCKRVNIKIKIKGKLNAIDSFVKTLLNQY